MVAEPQLPGVLGLVDTAPLLLIVSQTQATFGDPLVRVRTLLISGAAAFAAFVIPVTSTAVA